KNFATPLPPPMPLLTPACGSLHLAVNTRDWTFTSKISAMLGTQVKALRNLFQSALAFMCYTLLSENTVVKKCVKISLIFAISS
ncbi:MAG TPA: hypothetical protein H9955_01980, partial [Candidatus Mediterraneibacter cottocaccae]|nr:hypothetical protein [Candidatus Mediterraneibacter cottocaccae]